MLARPNLAAAIYGTIAVGAVLAVELRGRRLAGEILLGALLGLGTLALKLILH